MRCAPTRLIAIALAVAAVSGTTAAVAAARPPVSASHRGTEHFTFMFSSIREGDGSIIATGLFTDGGTINLSSGGLSATMKLGAGTIRLTTSYGSPSSQTNLATCLTTYSERGTYKLSDGTGRYAGIEGSGRLTVTDRVVLHHKRNGGCVTDRPPLAVQAIFTLSGSATLRR